MSPAADSMPSLGYVQKKRRVRNPKVMKAHKRNTYRNKVRESDNTGSIPHGKRALVACTIGAIVDIALYKSMKKLDS